MRLIDADALIDDLEHDVAIDEDILNYVGTVGAEKINTQFDKDCKQNAIDLLLRTPTIEPKQGEWIVEELDSIYGKKIRLKCSECGDTFDVTEGAFPYERYCRYCGARMKGADDGGMA